MIGCIVGATDPGKLFSRATRNAGGGIEGLGRKRTCAPVPGTSYLQFWSSVSRSCQEKICSCQSSPSWGAQVIM